MTILILCKRQSCCSRPDYRLFKGYDCNVTVPALDARITALEGDIESAQEDIGELQEDLGELGA